MDQQVAGGGNRGVLTAAASDERKKFRLSVGRLDTAFLMLVFLVPYGLITAALGTAFPAEGRPVGVGEAGVRPGRGGRGIGHGLGTAFGGTR